MTTIPPFENVAVAQQLPPPKEPAKSVSVSASYIRWSLRRSREAVIAQRCGKERMTSRRMVFQYAVQY